MEGKSIDQKRLKMDQPTVKDFISVQRNKL